MVENRPIRIPPPRDTSIRYYERIFDLSSLPLPGLKLVHRKNNFAVAHQYGWQGHHPQFQYDMKPASTGDERLQEFWNLKTFPYPDDAFKSIVDTKSILRYPPQLLYQYIDELGRILAPGGTTLFPPLRFHPVVREYIDQRILHNKAIQQVMEARAITVTESHTWHPSEDYFFVHRIVPSHQLPYCSFQLNKQIR